jgi:CubicO group peptidase (beta-lactamase class C family)
VPSADLLDLDAVIDSFFTRPVDEGVSLALVVQHLGTIVAERYGTQPDNVFQPARAIDAGSTLVSWSMAKSITHAAVGVLVLDGVLDVERPAPVPEWRGTAKAAITLLDLLEMRSGLEFIEDYVDDQTSHCIEMLFGDSGPSHAAYAANLPLLHDPGTVWNYSSGTSNIVARIVGDIVCPSPAASAAERRQEIDDFLNDRLFGPVGMTSATAKFDAAGDFVGSSYVYATARDFAAFGELYRHDGVSHLGRGTRILPVGWLDHARTTIAVDPDNGFGYGRHWWTWPQFPGSVACHGYQGQFTLVVPSRELVVVHLGLTPIDHAPELVRRLVELVESF